MKGTLSRITGWMVDKNPQHVSVLSVCGFFLLRCLKVTDGRVEILANVISKRRNLELE